MTEVSCESLRERCLTQPDSPEQYAQYPGTLRTTGPSRRRDAHTHLLRQLRTADQFFGTVRAPVGRDHQLGRRARARVVDAHRFRERRALGRVRVAVDAAHLSRRVATDLRRQNGEISKV